MGNSTITREEFTLLQKKANRIIQNISGEIVKGNIMIEPVYNAKTKTTTCKYCTYSGICGFDANLNSYAYVGNKTKDVIMEELKGDANGI